MDGNLVFVAALPQTSKGICFLIDRLGQRSKFAIIAFEGETSRHDSAARIFGWHIHTSHLKYEDISSLVDLL